MNGVNVSESNGRLAAQIEDMRDCVADLARRGALILNVYLGGDSVPLIYVRGAVHGLHSRLASDCRTNRGRTETWQATHKRCTVEWRIEK